jgi:hypothetical protein
VDEARYQATEWFPGAAEAHAAHTAGRTLFRSDPTFYLGLTAAPADDVRRLITLLGGRVVASPEQATICLGQPTQRSRRHVALPGTTTVEVPETWLYGADPSSGRGTGPAILTRPPARLCDTVPRPARGAVRQGQAQQWACNQGHQPAVLRVCRTCAIHA